MPCTEAAGPGRAGWWCRLPAGFPRMWAPALAPGAPAAWERGWGAPSRGWRGHGGSCPSPGGRGRGALGKWCWLQGPRHPQPGVPTWAGLGLVRRTGELGAVLATDGSSPGPPARHPAPPPAPPAPPAQTRLRGQARTWHPPGAGGGRAGAPGKGGAGAGRLQPISRRAVWWGRGNREGGHPAPPHLSRFILADGVSCGPLSARLRPPRPPGLPVCAGHEAGVHTSATLTPGDPPWKGSGTAARPGHRPAVRTGPTRDGHGMHTGCTHGVQVWGAHRWGVTQAARDGPAQVRCCGCRAVGAELWVPWELHCAVGAAAGCSLALPLLRPQSRAAFEVGQLPVPVLWPDLSAPRASPAINHSARGGSGERGTAARVPTAPVRAPAEPTAAGNVPRAAAGPRRAVQLCRAGTGTCTAPRQLVPKAPTGHASAPAKAPWARAALEPPWPGTLLPPCMVPGVHSPRQGGRHRTGAPGPVSWPREHSIHGAVRPLCCHPAPALQGHSTGRSLPCGHTGPPAPR